MKIAIAAALATILVAGSAQAQYYYREADGTSIPYVNPQAVPSFNYSQPSYDNDRYYQAPGIPDNLGTGQGASPYSPYYR